MSNARRPHKRSAKQHDRDNHVDPRDLRIVDDTLTCHTPKKIKYATRDHARRACRGLNATGRASDPKPYRCQSCKFWHVTGNRKKERTP